MTVVNPCTVCRLPTATWCSRCQQAWYCSPEHLAKDWPRHRMECVTGATKDASVLIPELSQLLSSLKSITALLFNINDERPHLVNLDCMSSAGPCPTPLVDQYFPNSMPQSVVLTKGLNGDPLRFPLHVFFCPISLQRGAPLNRGIARITSNAAPRPWCGPVLVLRFNGTRQQGYSNANMNDLTALSAYFLGFS